MWCAAMAEQRISDEQLKWVADGLTEIPAYLIEATARDLLAARELLRHLEWSAELQSYDINPWPGCPSCKRFQSVEGHATDCRLASLIGGGE